MTQLDAHLTGDQEVVGLTPAGSATFFRGDLIMKYFIRPFSLFLAEIAVKVVGCMAK